MMTLTSSEFMFSSSDAILNEFNNQQSQYYFFGISTSSDFTNPRGGGSRIFLCFTTPMQEMLNAVWKTNILTLHCANSSNKPQFCWHTRRTVHARLCYATECRVPSDTGNCCVPRHRGQAAHSAAARDGRCSDWHSAGHHEVLMFRWEMLGALK